MSRTDAAAFGAGGGPARDVVQCAAICQSGLLPQSAPCESPTCPPYLPLLPVLRTVGAIPLRRLAPPQPPRTRRPPRPGLLSDGERRAPPSVTRPQTEMQHLTAAGLPLMDSPGRRIPRDALLVVLGAFAVPEVSRSETLHSPRSDGLTIVRAMLGSGHRALSGGTEA
jgi:hypothetical protein